MTEETKPAKKLIGFAKMKADGRLDKLRELARQGGKEAHRLGAAYEYNSESGREAGKKGGQAVHRKRQEREANETGTAASEAGEGTT
jgi:general stress protein YciG